MRHSGQRWRRKRVRPGDVLVLVQRARGNDLLDVFVLGALAYFTWKPRYQSVAQIRVALESGGGRAVVPLPWL